MDRHESFKPENSQKGEKGAEGCSLCAFHVGFMNTHLVHLEGLLRDCFRSELAYFVGFVQLMQQPLVHHLVHPPVQPPVQLAVQYFVQLAVQPLVQLVQERHGSGVTVVLLVQLCTQVLVQPASHNPACAFDLPLKTEMTM